ncbi:MAG TPA: amidohydrolase family protein [Acidimicrobiia bacterium]|nr:amidohydrolase family protein [Acidimicrobiia bacterium]
MSAPPIPAPKRDSHAPTRFSPPPDACDAHCHIFGPANRFPFAADRSYTPPDSGLDELLKLQERLGLTRAVFVQASCHGTDNTAMLDALQRGEGRYAGVAMIDDTHTDADLAEMHRLGVRGIRFNFVAHLGGAPDLGRFQAMVNRLRPLGWHLELHFDARDLPRYAELLKELPTPFIIDHMARVRAADGIDQEPFRFLLELLETNTRSWVKISGAERITANDGPPYDDVVPFAQAVVEVAADRVVWGTDWPHPNVRHMPDDGDLVDLLADFVPDEATRNRILVDNPTMLYDFTG